MNNQAFRQTLYQSYPLIAFAQRCEDKKLPDLGFAALFSLFENLIQAVNILGSLFYGTILGIFLVAFFVRFVQGTAVFVAALIAQAAILALHFGKIEIAFLWYNLIAPAIVVVLAIALQTLLPKAPKSDQVPGT